MQMNRRFALLLIAWCNVTHVCAAANELERLSPVEVIGHAMRPQGLSEYLKAFFTVKEFESAKVNKESLKLKMRIRLASATNISPPDLQLKLSAADLSVDVPHRNLWADIPVDELAMEKRALFVTNVSAELVRLEHYVTIAKSSSGTYSDEYLVSACERALEATRSMNMRMRIQLNGKSCRGVVVLVHRNSLLNLAPSVMPNDLIRPSESHADPASQAYEISFDKPRPWTVHFLGDVVAIYPIYQSKGG